MCCIAALVSGACTGLSSIGMPDLWRRDRPIVAAGAAAGQTFPAAGPTSSGTRLVQLPPPAGRVVSTLMTLISAFCTAQFRLRASDFSEGPFEPGQMAKVRPGSHSVKFKIITSAAREPFGHGSHSVRFKIIISKAREPFGQI